MPLQFNRATRIATLPILDGLTITAQSLYNQFRDFEDEPQNLDLKQAIQGAGKDDLGALGQTVITVTLLDGWRLAFEARLGPTTEQTVVSGGNLVGLDALGAPQFPIAPTAFTAVTISQAVTGSDVGSLAAGVWNAQVDDFQGVGTFGEWMKTRLLTVAKFLGLN